MAKSKKPKLTAKAPPKQKKLTVKEAKLVKGIVEGKTKRQAAIDAGYSAKTAHVTASQYLKKPSVQQAFEIAMQKAGISDEKLAQKLNEGLDATKAVVMGKESVDSFVDVQPDFSVRHKYLETAIKIKGVGKDADGSSPNVHFHVHQSEQKEKYDL